MIKTIKIVLKVIVVLSVILAFYGLWANYTWALERYYRANVSLMIQKDPSVLDTEILFNENEDAVLKDFQYWILVSFNDGCTLKLTRVNEHGKGVMRIWNVDNYHVSFNNRSKDGVDDPEELKIWSAIIGTQIESVMDIVKNHHIISNYVKTIPDLDEHRSEEEIRLAVEGLVPGWEIDHNVRDRLLADNALPLITVDNVEYYVSKWVID